MEGVDGFYLKIDSVMDLRVPVCDESNVEVEGVDEWHAVGSVVRSGTGSFPGIGTVGAPLTTHAGRWELLDLSSIAGTDKHFEHATGDDRSAEGFGFLTRSTARSFVEAGTTGGLQTFQTLCCCIN